MNNFESKVVIVTGGAGGIGKATCDAFINSKATVLCVDNHKERIEKFKSSYKSSNLFIFNLDITKEKKSH